MDNPPGLRELYEASHGRLVAAVAAVCGSVSEAEDCVQDAFAKAVPRWDRLASYDDPEAWIREVAVNASRSRWRRRRRFDDLADRLAGPPTSRGPTEDHVALMAALRRLPAEQRDAVVLHHLVDLPVEEIAARAGVPAGTVKARLSRGRRALAQHLGVDDAGETGSEQSSRTTVRMTEVRLDG